MSRYGAKQMSNILYMTHITCAWKFSMVSVEILSWGTIYNYIYIDIQIEVESKIERKKDK